MPTLRVEVRPELLRWARERANLDARELATAFPRLAEWERGESHPTIKQLERFAHRTHAPVGYFFLAEPPDEPLPIPDYRTIRSEALVRPSVDLLDTIYACQQRQSWYREFAEVNADGPVEVVGSIGIGGSVVSAATQIRSALGLDLDARRAARTWEAALADLIRQTESLGVLVMRNGVVGNNTHRKLDPAEFRGFALSDRLAPVIFVNAADSKSAQMFTLAHELVHVAADRTGVSDASPRRVSDQSIERWCNQVAAEVLVPLVAFEAAYDRDAVLSGELHRLARRFKVSTLVILRRMHDAGGLTQSELWAAYDAELERLQGLAPNGSGGDFHATEAVRVSPRFARAVIASTIEGYTLYRDAFQLLGLRKAETFKAFGARLGFQL